MENANTEPTNPENTTTIPASEKETPEQEIPLEPIADILARTKENSPQKPDSKEDEKKEEEHKPQNEAEKTDPQKSSPKGDAQKSDDTASTQTDETSQPEDSLSHWQKEVEKSERRLADSQKWGREAHGKLKSVEAMIAQYLGQGILSDEEAALLLASAQHPEPGTEQKDEPLLVRYGTIWDRELANMRKYTDSPDLDRHIQAFQHFLKNGSPADVTEAFTELKALEKDEVAFTKKMLQMGKAYHDEVYKEIHEAGSLKAYKIKKEQEIAKHLRHIDKLEKEIVKYKEQYEDYTPAKSYRLPSGGSAESPKDSDSSIGSILDRAKMGNLRR